MESNQTNWQYKPESGANNGPTDAPAAHSGPKAVPAPVETAEVTWNAPEFLAHDRGSGWYAVLALATVVVAGLAYLLTKDYVATVTMFVLGIIVALFAHRQPRDIEYQLSNVGMHVGPKFYPYRAYQTFSVVRDQGINSIVLMPLKRFAPPLSAFFMPQDEDQIVAVIGDHLPYEESTLDLTERLSRRLRL